ncbi:hypothetical protein [Streptomyces kronopolitis]|uniref:hypothetical protein n=1 Tax=Streptomyces kronopolitis TaxID=1612435 RepID=UPI0020BD6EF8|nr:hypothetical protein [Streptomyces kronopolitis]MCL6296929.1 hypothetical protein [Streptomyces kronopolitis]
MLKVPSVEAETTAEMVETTESRRIGDPDPGSAIFQRKRWLIIAVAVLAVVASGVFYFSGAYDRWRDNRTFADTCRGSVDTSEVKELLGADRVRGHDVEVQPGINPRAGRLHKCAVSDPEGAAWLSVALDWGSDAAGALHDFGGFSPYEDGGMAVPLGHGWEGVMAEGGVGSDRVAMVNMPCSNRRSDPERSSLVVTVQSAGTQQKGGAAQRDRFARTAVETAGNAAKAWGCTARPGGAIESLPEPGSTTAREGMAQGTCQGIKAAVRESATASKAPIENCYLLSDSGTAQYRVSAFYGPFAHAVPAQIGYGDVFDSSKPAGRKGSGVWASAGCPSGGRALYIVTALPDTDDHFDPDGHLANAALKTFATHSAERHGCGDLKFP